MARQTIELLIDDLDGTRLAKGEGDTVTFAYQGAEYTIDLSQEHISEFENALAKYIGSGQKISGNRRSSSSTTTTRSSSGSGAKPDKAQLQAMRQWARENGYEVSDRGRVSQKVIDAYNAQK